MPAPAQLILEYELLNQQLRRVLLWHTTDRWYLGDFIRHSSWLSTLKRVNPQVLDLVTHLDYLSLYGDGRISNLIDASGFTAQDAASYDLVVIPSAYKPFQYSSCIRRAIYSWDRGWAYSRYGLEIAREEKSEINYWQSAKHQYGQTALPSSSNFPLSISSTERSEATTNLTNLLRNELPLIVYNPSASNSFTRQTSLKKEVDNTLALKDHAALINHTAELFPDHGILVASSLKRNDRVNSSVISDLKKLFRTRKNIVTILDDGMASMSTLRGFSSILENPRVRATLGGGTGTNTHLAALVGLPSLSIERSADSTMMNNWKDPNQFQMGSFRWRNPSPLAASYSIDWHKKSDADLYRAALAFKHHYESIYGSTNSFFGARAKTATTHARNFISKLNPSLVGDAILDMVILGDLIDEPKRDFYLDFKDELSYLRLKSGFEHIRTWTDCVEILGGPLANYRSLATNLIKSSNLHKLATRLVPTNTTPEPADELGDILFKKIRAGVSLNSEELNAIGVESEYALSREISRVAEARLAKSGILSNASDVIGQGWQHIVSNYETIVAKRIATNRASEYLTDEYTTSGINDALRTAGGLVPPSLLIGSGPLRNLLISTKLTPFVKSVGQTYRSQDGTPIEQVELPVGWVKEHIDQYVKLIKQGAFNFDCKFLDAGVDKFGVLKTLDFSVIRVIEEVIFEQSADRRTDIFRMGVGELIINGQLLTCFANGDELIRHYNNLIRLHLGIDLASYFGQWRWGMQEEQAIDNLCEKLKEFVRKASRRSSPKPVYGLVDTASEDSAYEYIQQELNKKQLNRSADNDD